MKKCDIDYKDQSASQLHEYLVKTEMSQIFKRSLRHVRMYYNNLRTFFFFKKKVKIYVHACKNNPIH